MSQSKPSRLSTREWVLVILLIGVVQFTIQIQAFNWCGNGELLSYLSFAGVVTSIILAVLAIIYSFFSNTTLQQFLGSIQGASETISAESTKLSGLMDTFEREIKGMPGMVAEGMKPALGVFEGGFSKLLENNRGSFPSQQLDQEFLDLFLSKSPLLGVLSLYLCALANETNRPFYPVAIFGDEGERQQTLNNAVYFTGFLTASNCAGILDYTLDSENNFTVVKMEYESDSVKEVLVERLGGERYGEETTGYANRKKSEIEEFFLEESARQ
jgi:hypothetical protein